MRRTTVDPAATMRKLSRMVGLSQAPAFVVNLPPEEVWASAEASLPLRTRWLAHVLPLMPGLLEQPDAGTVEGLSTAYTTFCAAAEATAGRGHRRSVALSSADRVQIEADLPRSEVAELGVCIGDPAAHEAALARLLRAWCVLRPDVGYSQAMNFVAAVLVALFRHDEAGRGEALAFGAFVALLSRLDPKFYDARLTGFYVEAKGQ